MVAIDVQGVHRHIGIEHAVGQHRDAAGAAHRADLVADRLQRAARDVGAAEIDHDVGGDDAGRHVDQHGDVELVVAERLGPIAAEFLREGAPGVLHLLQLDGGEIDVLVAQVADRDAVVGRDVFHGGIEQREVVGRRGVRADQKDGARRDADPAQPHGFHRFLTRSVIPLRV